MFSLTDLTSLSYRSQDAKRTTHDIPSQTSQRLAVLAPVTRSRRNVPLPLRTQPEPEDLLLPPLLLLLFFPFLLFFFVFGPPTRYQHESAKTCVPETVVVLAVGAAAEFGGWEGEVERTGWGRGGGRV